jgi:peptidoglycan/LPS O-acetylase OafA/YrhL
MERFRGIEGTRGWLALIVLLAHLVTATGFAAVIPAAALLGPLSGSAVTVFIIISGFVSAHLQLSRAEPYPLYLARRALRIYPVYLVAPLAIAAFRRPGWSLFLLAVLALGHLAFIQGILGRYYTPSLLPAAGAFFAIGILSRLYLDRLPKLRRVPVAIILALLALAVILPQTAYLAGWAIVLGFILLEPEALQPGRRRLLARLLQLALDTGPARALGRRSYAIYLLHQPVITGVTAVGAVGLDLGPVGLFLFTSAISIIVVSAGAELIHRTIEQPAINYGRRLGGAPASRGAVVEDRRGSA